MPMRTTSRAVTFRRPFFLSGFDAPQAAGTYTVETEEELLDGLSFLAYRRKSTTIYLHAQAGHPMTSETVAIDPDELDAALARDAEPAAP
jgi:hypothetical protein